MNGWIKLHRKFSDKAFYSKDSEKVHLWIHLLIKATRKEREEMLGGKPFVCKPGQFTCGRKQLSIETGINESKIERILTYFEKIEQQIEQQKTSKNRLITILSWESYQQTEQQNEQQVNNDRTTSEQQVNTLQEDKEFKEGKEKSKPPIKKFKKPSVNEIKNYCVERKNKVDAQKFYDYYESNGWKVGKNSMKNWQAAIRTWEKYDSKETKTTIINGRIGHDSDFQ